MRKGNALVKSEAFYKWSIVVMVSGDVFAHNQEHITVTTASGNVHRCCRWLVLQHQPAAT